MALTATSQVPVAPVVEVVLEQQGLDLTVVRALAQTLRVHQSCMDLEVAVAIALLSELYPQAQEAPRCPPIRRHCRTEVAVEQMQLVCRKLDFNPQEVMAGPVSLRCATRHSKTWRGKDFRGEPAIQHPLTCMQTPTQFQPATPQPSRWKPGCTTTRGLTSRQFLAAAIHS